MAGVRIIAELTLREARRRRIIAAAFGLGFAFLVLYGLGLYLLVGDTRFQGVTKTTPPVIRRQAFNMLLMMGLYATNWLMVLVTVLCSVDTLSGEIASGTMQSLATKPVPRWQLVLGKWLGFAAILSSFLLFMAGGVMFEMWLIAGHVAPNVLPAIGLMCLESLVLLAVSFRAGASLSTLATGVVVFGLHILAFTGGFLEEIGFYTKSATLTSIGVVTSLVMPSESLWKKAGSGLQGPLIGEAIAGPFTFMSVPSNAMVAYAGLYLVVALALATHRFSRRDL